MLLKYMDWQISCRTHARYDGKNLFPFPFTQKFNDFKSRDNKTRLYKRYSHSKAHGLMQNSLRRFLERKIKPEYACNFAGFWNGETYATENTRTLQFYNRCSWAPDFIISRCIRGTDLTNAIEWTFVSFATGSFTTCRYCAFYNNTKV